MKPKLAAFVLILVCRAALPQSAEPGPKFSAIDIHPSKGSSMLFLRGMELHGTRLELRNVTMVDLISNAYGVDRDKVFGGPSWLEYDHHDVIALAPAKSSPEALKLMLQSLLADRFHLVAKPATKPLPAFSLKTGKQLKLKAADGTGEADCTRNMKANADQGPDGPVAGRLLSITMTMNCRNMTMAALLEQIPIPRPAGQPNRPVIDETGLKGAWNFDLEITLDNGQFQPSVIASALDKQLGLKFEEITMPLPVVEVVSVNREPDANSPTDLKAFPPLPTEFDVAEIKPANPDAMAGRGGRGGGPAILAIGAGALIFGEIQNGRVLISNVSLQSLITQAWNLQNSDFLVGAPKWLGSDLWDVVAKVPPGFADAFTDFESLQPMIRNLLTEKFKLQVHTEQQPQTGYVLTAVKPKMKKADPNGRTRWMGGVPEGEKDPRPGNPPQGRVVTCQNMSMDQFAELLPNIAGGYFQGTTVVNRTGLEGQFDFTFYFLPAGRAGLRGGGGRAATVFVGGVVGGVGGDNGASDPSGGLSLFDSVTKLLGLKIDTEKRPMPVVVIDHVEQKPVEN